MISITFVIHIEFSCEALRNPVVENTSKGSHYPQINRETRLIHDYSSIIGKVEQEIQFYLNLRCK